MWRSSVALDFDLVSGMANKLPPAWDGKWILTDRILQILTIQNIDGPRCFIIGFDETDTISIWELTKNDWFDDGEEIQWEISTKSYPFENPLALKLLKSTEMWMSELGGNVSVDSYYKADTRECWSPWGRWEQSFGTCKSVPNRATGCKPTLFNRPPVKTRVAFPEPPIDDNYPCDGQVYPSNNGYEFQVKLKLTGHAKLRRLRVFADERFENEFGSIQNNCDTTTLVQTECENCSNA